MPKYRSSVTTQGPLMSGARSLWRATGMTDRDFDKPIIAVVNSFSQFVPGHVHLKDVGSLVSTHIEKHGGVAREFNTIAIDDGIAMGHSGMLYSLPSRELIADSVEYVVNAHCVDAMVCISNCDKITPGMLMASLRLNIPTIFVSGGPMEAGRTRSSRGESKIDLIDAITSGASAAFSNDEKKSIEESACATCGSCAGLFTANSMNCLTEALGLALPGNGSLLATHSDRNVLFADAGRRIVHLAKCFYLNEDASVLPRSIANREAFENAMSLDIAMGGSTNTVLHLLASAHEGQVRFALSDIHRLAQSVPHLCKISPSIDRYHMEDLHRSGGVWGVLGELDRAHLLHRGVRHVLQLSLPRLISLYDITKSTNRRVRSMYMAGPSGKRTQKGFSQSFRWSLDDDRRNGCIRSQPHAYSLQGGLTVLYGNLAEDGCVVKTAGIDEKNLVFRGSAAVYESQNDAVSAILEGRVLPGTVIVIRYEGPKGGPGMQEMLYPTAFLKSMGLDQHCALVTDGRFSGGTSGISVGHVSPEAANRGTIGLVENGDFIHIDAIRRRILLRVSTRELDRRRRRQTARKESAWTPTAVRRDRRPSVALRAYARFATSADRGAVRVLDS